MRRVLVILVVTVATVSVLPRDALAAQSGDGQPHIARLPWLATEGRVLTTGWGGCTSFGSHCPGNPDQYAVDFAAAGSPSPPFNAYAATESDVASCQDTSTSGHIAVVTRIDGKTERYVHLAGCPSAGTHLEQGDLIGLADGSGSSSTGAHLHFELRNTSSGPTVKFELSGLENKFCAFALRAQCAGVTYQGQTYTSDNAGPGVGAPSPQNGKMRFSYIAGGHNAEDCAPGEEAWDCYGSSVEAGGKGPKAFHAPTAGEWAWHQWFVAPDLVWHALNMPDACSAALYAYVIPNEYFTLWLNSGNQLGQPRSQVIAGSGGWYFQRFRYANILSTAYGSGNPFIYGGANTICE